MSGLFGYIGKRRALPVITQGLKLMSDYRYDSCGLILKNSGKFFIKKVIGTVRELESEVIDYNGPETMGAAHLRWATHGGIEEQNIHPLMDCHGRIALMHKGIIENFRELKNLLENEGHQFRSDTDSEVLVHLIEKYYEGELALAARKALLQVQGTYALVVFCLDAKQELVAANAGMGMMLGNQSRRCDNRPQSRF